MISVYSSVTDGQMAPETDLTTMFYIFWSSYHDKATHNTPLKSNNLLYNNWFFLDSQAVGRLLVVMKLNQMMSDEMSRVIVSPSSHKLLEGFLTYKIVPNFCSILSCSHQRSSSTRNEWFTYMIGNEPPS